MFTVGTADLCNFSWVTIFNSSRDEFFNSFVNALILQL